MKNVLASAASLLLSVTAFAQPKTINMNSIQQKVNADRAFFSTLGNFYPADAGVDIRNETIDGVSCYWFTPGDAAENRIILYLHGGSYGLGSIQSHRAMVSHFATAFAAKFLFIEYALAPENPYPAGVNNVLQVYREIVKKYPGVKVSIMGDSAGGGLSVSFIHKAAKEKLPAPENVVIISPWINLTLNTASYETRKHLEHVITKEMLVEYADYYAAGNIEKADPSQLEFRSFPPLFILVGSNEILFDDSKLFYEKIRPLQQHTIFKEYPDQAHVWPMTDINAKSSREALEDIRKFFSETTGK